MVELVGLGVKRALLSWGQETNVRMVIIQSTLPKDVKELVSYVQPPAISERWPELTKIRVISTSDKYARTKDCPKIFDGAPEG